MTRRTAEAYNAMWDEVFKIVPELNRNVKTFTSDYELAAIKSTQEKFLDLTSCGCVIHFKRVSVNAA